VEEEVEMVKVVAELVMEELLQTITLSVKFAINQITLPLTVGIEPILNFKLKISSFKFPILWYLKLLHQGIFKKLMDHFLGRIFLLVLAELMVMVFPASILGWSLILPTGLQHSLMLHQQL
jgi:hypothetical protein